MTSLESLAEGLRKQLGVAAVFNSINTRLIIQTGINLKKFTPEQNKDPATLMKVTDGLRKMGIDMEAA